MPSATTRRERIAALAATAEYNPEEAANAQAILDRMPRDLDSIAADIKAEYGKGVESQFAIGRLLAEAWAMFRGDKVAYGRWMQLQDFEFHRNTGQLLRLAAEREPEVRAYLAEANDPKGSHRSIGVHSAIREMVAGKPRATQARVEVGPPAPADPAFAAFRAGCYAVLGWTVGDNGRGAPTVNGFAAMHIDDLHESAVLLQYVVQAYETARKANIPQLTEDA